MILRALCGSDGKGRTCIQQVTHDDEPASAPRPSSEARAAFKKDGTVTAASASTISDGAACMLLMSRAAANTHGCKVLATIKGYGDAEQDPSLFTTAPAKALPVAAVHAGIELDNVDLFEINEAFSVVALANNKLLNLDAQKVNINGAQRRAPALHLTMMSWTRLSDYHQGRVTRGLRESRSAHPRAFASCAGGAVSLGHPIGASGARIAVTLLHALQQRGSKIGAAGICNGGGGASAIILERES